MFVLGFTLAAFKGFLVACFCGPSVSLYTFLISVFSPRTTEQGTNHPKDKGL